MINPELEALLRLAAEAGQPKMHELPVEVLRKSARERRGNGRPWRAGERVRDVVFSAGAGERAARIYWPDRPVAADVIVFFTAAVG